jgi:hypothetical protein
VSGQLGARSSGQRRDSEVVRTRVGLSRRTRSTYLDAFTDIGFIIESVGEPRVPVPKPSNYYGAEALRRQSEHRDQRHAAAPELPIGVPRQEVLPGSEAGTDHGRRVQEKPAFGLRHRLSDGASII